MNILRDTNKIDIIKVIVHVIDVHTDSQAQKSQQDIDISIIDPKVCEFINEHIGCSIKNNESRLSRFDQRGTNVQVLINEIIQDPEQKFINNTQILADTLFAVTPQTASPGCIVVVLYNNSHEDLLAIIKLDKGEAVSYEFVNGSYGLVVAGNALPIASKSSKLHKFAVARDTDTITDQEWDNKPGLIVLDKQVASFSLFFYKQFLAAEFLLTDEHKSEKLILGLKQYLRSTPDVDLNEQTRIINSFGSKIINNEEFTVDEAARQILSPYFTEQGSLEDEVERLERTVLAQGIGDINLRGASNGKIEKMLGIHKLKTTENITINFPTEYLGTKLIVTDSDYGDGKDILIKDVHIKQ